MDFGTDAVAKAGKVSVRRVPAINKSEGVAGGDAGISERKSLFEASLLDKPRGGELDARTCAWHGPVGDLWGLELERLGKSCELLGGDEGILEEGTCGTAVGFAGREKHALPSADLSYGVVDVERRGLLAGKASGEISVGEVGFGVGQETKIDRRDDISTASSGVEQAAAITEPAVLIREFDKVAGLEVQGANRLDCLRNLLPIGADVLNGCPPGKTRNTREALHAAESQIAGK